ncbi:MAG: ribosome maturation factor RimP [Candidatus Edwardsbacteria bacterium]
MLDEKEEVLDKIRNIVTPLVVEEGLELVNIEFLPKPKILRIFVDRLGGITLAECASLSQKISARLDEEDPFPFSYQLEVSSPGLNRALKNEADYKKFIGRLVRLQTKSQIDGEYVHPGRLLDFTSGMIKIEKWQKSFKKEKIIWIPFSEIKKARLEIGGEMNEL